MAERRVTFEIFARDLASKTLAGVGKGFSTLGRTAASAGKVVAVGAGVAALGGVAALSAGLVQGVKDAAAYETLAKKTAAVLKSTGNAARTSVADIQARAGALESMSGVDETLIINGQNVLATFTAVQNRVGKGNDIFNQATATALDMSVALGTDLQGANIQLGKALNDPVKGISALSRVGVSFTKQQKDQIKTLVASGDTLGAQKVILAELSKEFGGAAKAAGSGFEGSLARLKDTAGDFGRQVGAALLPKLTSLFSWLNDKLPKAIDWLKDAWASFLTAFTTKNPLGRFTDGAFKMQRAGYLVRVMFDKVSQAARLLAGWFTGTLMPAIRTTVATVMPMFRLALDNVRKALGSAGKAGGDWGTRLHALGQVVKVVLQAVIFAVAAFAVIWSAQMRIVAGVVNKVVLPAIRFIWTVFSKQVGLILTGAAKAFGWIPGLGPKLKTAAADFARFAAATNRALAGIKNRQVTVTIRRNTIDYSDGRTRSKSGPNQMRAHGGGLTVGMAYQVNEAGQEMLRLTDRSAAVIPHAQSQRMLRTSGGGGNVYNFYLSGMYGNRQQLARDIRAIMAEARGSGALAGA